MTELESKAWWKGLAVSTPASGGHLSQFVLPQLLVGNRGHAEERKAVGEGEAGTCVVLFCVNARDEGALMPRAWMTPADSSGRAWAAVAELQAVKGTAVAAMETSRERLRYDSHPQ